MKVRIQKVSGAVCKCLVYKGVLGIAQPFLGAPHPFGEGVAYVLYAKCNDEFLEEAVILV